MNLESSYPVPPTLPPLPPDQVLLTKCKSLSVSSTVGKGVRGVRLPDERDDIFQTLLALIQSSLDEVHKEANGI